MYTLLILLVVGVVVAFGVMAFGGWGGDRVIYRRRRVAAPAYVERPVVVEHARHVEYVHDCPECAQVHRH